MTRLSLVALFLATPLVAQQPARRPLAADTAAIRVAMAAAFGERGDAETESLFAIQLPRIRTAVLTLLGRGSGAEAVNRWFGSLPGFQGPQHGQGTTVGGVHFFSTLDRSSCRPCRMPRSSPPIRL